MSPADQAAIIEAVGNYVCSALAMGIGFGAIFGLFRA